MKHAAEKAEIDLSTSHLDGQRPQIREVVFLDTADFRLYNHAFILRRRVLYEDGFPVGDPEIVFKFRHPDMQKAADLDVRPHIPGSTRSSSRRRPCPSRTRWAAYVILYSHNAEFGLSQVKLADRTGMSTLVRFFPASPPQEVARRSGRARESDHRRGGALRPRARSTSARAWWPRTTSACGGSGDHASLVGKYAFQAKFDRQDDLHPKVQHRVEEFFLAVQNLARDWVSVGATKTGIVYRLKGNPPGA